MLPLEGFAGGEELLKRTYPSICSTLLLQQAVRHTEREQQWPTLARQEQHYFRAKCIGQSRAGETELVYL